MISSPLQAIVVIRLTRTKTKIDFIIQPWCGHWIVKGDSISPIRVSGILDRKLHPMRSKRFDGRQARGGRMVIKVDHVVRVAPLLVARAETFLQAPTGLPRPVS